MIDDPAPAGRRGPDSGADSGAAFRAASSGPTTGSGAAAHAASAAAATELTPVAQDYLKVIWTAAEWDDAPVSTKLLAERVGSAPSTVSETVRRLSDRGLVDHVRYGAITLTAAGRAAALAMVRRHRLIETFLVRQLGYTWAEVHDEAEVLEHAVSDRLVDRIDGKLGHPQTDPHGDPIPRSDGTVPAIPGVRLTELAPGADGTITRISDEHPELLRYFDALGIAPGTTVRMVERRDFAGTLSVLITGAGNGPSPTAAPGAGPARSVELGRPAADAILLVEHDSR